MRPSRTQRRPSVSLLPPPVAHTGTPSKNEIDVLTCCAETRRKPVLRVRQSSIIAPAKPCAGSTIRKLSRAGIAHSARPIVGSHERKRTGRTGRTPVLDLFDRLVDRAIQPALGEMADREV